MGMVSTGRYLDTSGMNGGQSVYRTGIRELRCDRGGRYMIRIKRAGGLAFGVLGFNFIHGPKARYAGYPRERHGIGD